MASNQQLNDWQSEAYSDMCTDGLLAPNIWCKYL